MDSPLCISWVAIARGGQVAARRCTYPGTLDRRRASRHFVMPTRNWSSGSRPPGQLAAPGPFRRLRTCLTRFVGLRSRDAFSRLRNWSLALWTRRIQQELGAPGQMARGSSCRPSDAAPAFTGFGAWAALLSSPSSPGQGSNGRRLHGSEAGALAASSSSSSSST